VTDDVGDVVAGARVTATRLGRSWRGITDEDGRFGFTAAAARGSAVVTATARDHDPVVRRIILGLDRVLAVTPVLVRHVGFLKLDSDPEGVAPLIDGSPARDCPATPCQPSVLVGHHVVGVGGDLYLPWSQDVLVAQGQAITLKLQASRKTGTLKIDAPTGELFLDASRVASGAWSGTVPTGHHTVGFRSAATWPLFAGTDVAWNQAAALSLQPHPVTPGDVGAFISEL